MTGLASQGKLMVQTSALRIMWSARFSVTQTRFNNIILNLAQTHKVSLGDLIFISDYALILYIEFDSEDLGINQAPVCTYLNSVEKREFSILRRLSDKSHGIGIRNNM